MPAKQTSVMVMQRVQIQLEITTVLVMMALAVMDSNAKVRFASALLSMNECNGENIFTR